MILPADALAQDTPPLRIPRTTTAPTIDGRLDESLWAGAAVVTLAYQWYPGDNTPAPVATRCFLASDATHLYIGCSADDPAPESIRRHFADRDDIGGDDQIRVLLDPFGSSRRGFRFSVTALGAQADALYSEETGDDETWDATWQSAGRVGDTGFVVEFAIPFTALRPPTTGEGRLWRLIIERRYPRGAAYQIGSVIRDRSNNCLLCQAALISEVGGGGHRANVALQPTVTGTRSEEERAGGGLDAETELEIGLSGRWELSPASRLNATVNPDFSQVEADAAEFEVNRRFALAFDEKRTFFLDGQNYFDVPANLVFTRTVVDPIAGLKVTGNRGSHALGAFVTLDNVNSVIVPGSQSSERVSDDSKVIGAVTRYRTDLPNSSSLGILATGRRATEYANGTVAIDGALRIGQSHRVRFVGAGSYTDDAPAVELVTGRTGAFAGGLGNLRYDLETRNWGVEVGYRGISGGFRNDAGLVQRVDLTGPEIQVSRTIWGDRAGWFDRIGVAVEGQRLTRFNGAVVDEKVELGLRYEGPLQSEFGVEHAWRREAFEDRLFDRQVTELSFEIQPGDAVQLAAETGFGDEIDSDNAQLARFWELGLSTRLRLGRPIRLNVRGRYQRLAVDAGRLFDAYLADARLEYHFGLRTFVRLIVQHREVRSDPTLFTEPVPARSNRLFSQFLFSYQANPETVLFLGYSGTARDFMGVDIIPQQRTFFFKVGYGFRP